MSKWTHAICPDCWITNNPGRVPVTTVDKVVETCCYCGVDTGSGIYVRADPTTVNFCDHERND